MSRNTVQDAEGFEGTICDACQLVPLTVLSLDHPEPLVGWPAFLRARGIELIGDDLGRPAIGRADARQLMTEREEWARRTAEETARRQEQVAREAPAIHRGILRPANADPALTAIEVMRLVDVDAEEADPRRRISPREEFLLQRLGPPQKVVVEED